MAEITFNKYGSYYIREGWFEKAINAIKLANTNIFHKDDTVYYLGISQGMCQSLKYWLRAAKVIDSSTNMLTEFGELLYQYDKYLESPFSWFLIHYHLSANRKDCPIIYEVFNSNVKIFTKESILNRLQTSFSNDNICVDSKVLVSDLNLFLTSYSKSEMEYSPEDNYYCPLSRLKLITKEGETYKRTQPAFSKLSHMVVYYALLNCYGGKQFELDDSLICNNSPVKIFNLDTNAYLEYLQELKREKIINIDRAVGLNFVCFNKTISLEEIFSNNDGF